MDLMVGILLVVAGGALEGLFSLPVTRTPGWRWENIWGIGSLVALVLVPWPVALLTVPDLAGVYAGAGAPVVLATFLFGLGWGLGGIFWGKAIAAVGMALGVSLLMGLINIFGSPVPLAIKAPAKLISPGGLALMTAVAVMALGVVACALAGARKEKELAVASARPGSSTPFGVGLLFCVASGVLSAMVNFGLVFGEPIAEAASRAGASDAAKNNAIWAMVFTGNYAVNAVFAFYLMFRNNTARRVFSHGTPAHWLWALFMGVAWPLGIVLFGIGANKMGPAGAFVAFPMMLVMAILFGNLAGVLTGEWRGTSSRTKTTMLAGVVVLFAAFAVFGWSSRLFSAGAAP